MKNTDSADFCIEIDFDKKSSNPSRIFKTMSDLIDSFQSLDNDLIAGIDLKLEPILLLEDIEAGSLKTYIVNIIRGIPDEALKSGDWKKLLGHYLVKAKYIILSKLEDTISITDAKLIEDIQSEIFEEAKNTDLKEFPNYTPIQLPKLISNINRIKSSVSSLNTNESVKFLSTLGDATFNIEWNFTVEDMENLITREKIESTTPMILKVKKPDYLGNSMWDFKLGGKLINAKILHNKWLSQFQKREIDIRPGDSLRALVKVIAKYGHDFELIGNSYEILEVIEIIRLQQPYQLRIDDDKE